jgi:hypothetical protein
MLGDKLMPQLDELSTEPERFMQDGAPPHYALSVHHWLNNNFINRWISQSGTVE